MKFLFVHQNCPGQYLHLVRALAREGEHEILFATHPNANILQGVRKVEYLPERSSTPGIHVDAAEFESAAIRASSAAAAFRRLAGIGFVPDVIVGHNGWGELLHVRDVWPSAPVLGYFEFFYHERGLDLDFDPEFPPPPELRPRVRMKNAVNLLGLHAVSLGHTPTAFQRNTYPPWARERIEIVPEGVDLAVCRPDARASFALEGRGRWRRGSGRPLLTFVARNLEPYRGFHVFLRAVAMLARARDDFDVVIVGGSGTSYGASPPRGSWRDIFLASLPHPPPEGRIHIIGTLSYEDYVRLLQASAVHTYLTYPFVASWSLREALACGCTVLGSDTAPVREFIDDGANGRLTPFHDPVRLASMLEELLDDPEQRRSLGREARRRAVATLDVEGHVRHMRRLLDRLMDRPSRGADAEG